jgi:RNA polymerase sigma-70 factor, ECF subfamily
MDGASRAWAAGSWPAWTITVAHREGAPATETPADLGALDERALVRECLAGRTEAFGEIVTRHRRPIYQVCYRFVGNHEDATDLAQETFLRAFRAIGSFKGDASVGTWLYRIAVNVCLNRVSSRGVRVEPIDDRDLPPSAEPDAMSRLMSDERAARVRAAVSRLPPRQRATLILRVYQELSHQEIARILGSSVGAAKANLFHALNNLRKLLDRDPL